MVVSLGTNRRGRNPGAAIRGDGPHAAQVVGSLGRRLTAGGVPRAAPMIQSSGAGPLSTCVSAHAARQGCQLLATEVGSCPPTSASSRTCPRWRPILRVRAVAAAATSLTSVRQPIRRGVAQPPLPQPRPGAVAAAAKAAGARQTRRGPRSQEALLPNGFSRTVAVAPRSRRSQEEVTRDPTNGLYKTRPAL